MGPVAGFVWLVFFHLLHLSFNRGGRRATTDDLATSFIRLSLFFTALWGFANSRLVHSLMLSSHLFFSLPCLLPPFTVPCKMVLARPRYRRGSLCQDPADKGPHEDLTIVKRRKLKWHWRVILTGHSHVFSPRSSSVKSICAIYVGPVHDLTDTHAARYKMAALTAVFRDFETSIFFYFYFLKLAHKSTEKLLQIFLSSFLIPCLSIGPVVLFALDPDFCLCTSIIHDTSVS